jgi:hypothetical protein
MFSSPSTSPTNRSLLPRPFHSNPCHPERSEGSTFPRSASPPFALLLFGPSTFSLIFARPLFSYSCALFCHNENDKLFVFRRFHTLCQKHPGWGSAIDNFFVAQTSVCALLRQSTSERSAPKDPQQLKNLAVRQITSHESPLTPLALFLPPVTNHQSPVTSHEVLYNPHLRKTHP